MNGREREGERETLIEASVASHRERDREGRIVPPRAWRDLPPEACEEVFRRQLLTRELEKATDPDGLSGTARAVLARIGWKP
jgi:hypothetical protein